MNEGRVAVWHQHWYSHLLSFLLNTKFTPGWSEHCTDKKQTERWLAHLPDTPLLPSSLVLGQFFFVFFLTIDSDGGERSFTVPYCLPAARVWLCLMYPRPRHGPVPACWPPNTNLRQSWTLKGRKEGRKHTSKTDKTNRKTTASHQSVSAYTFWHSSRVLLGCFLTGRRRGIDDYKA